MMTRSIAIPLAFLAAACTLQDPAGQVATEEVPDFAVIDRSDLPQAPPTLKATTGSGQLVYVNFNGVTIRNCRTWTDSVDNCSTAIAATGSSSATFTPWGGAVGRDLVLEQLRMRFEGFNVSFTTTRPPSTTPYMMLVVSHTDPGLKTNQDTPYRGWAPIDCQNSYKYDVAFTMDTDPDDDYTTRANTVGKLAAHEIGHSLGLEHVTDGFDLMRANVDEAIAFKRSPLRDPSICLPQFSDQDGVHRLNEWVGTADLPARRRLNSAPAVASMRPGHLDVFALGSRGDVIHKYYQDGQWSPWYSIDGFGTSTPSVVSWADGRIDVFVRSTDNALWHRFWDASMGGWSNWGSLGGVLTSAPSVASMGAGHLDVYVRGSDNAMHHRYFWGGWSGWQSRGGLLTSAPTAVSWGWQRIDTFVRGWDGALVQKYYDNGFWSEWYGLGGYFIGNPAAISAQSGHLGIYVRATDNTIWQKGFWNSWTNWESLGGFATSSPGAVSWGPGRIDLFVRGADYTLQHRYYDWVWRDWHAQ